MALTVAVTLFFFVSELGRDSGIQLNYIGAVAIAFVIFGLKHMKLVVLVVLVCIAGNIGSHFLFETGRVQWAVDDWFMGQIYVLSATTIMIILAATVWYAFRVAADAEARSKRLLDNVLPTTIADQLMREPDELIADRFDEATVLFADIVGFTDMSERLEAVEMVQLLNELFTGFDAVAAKLSIEKIKTIGDAYMAVSGVPKLTDNHAAQIVQLAIGMQTVAEELSARSKYKLYLRVGIATGPITAGVIGKTKFAYDVWSPTVNLAARLESVGKPGDIHISDATHNQLKNDFMFEKAPQSNLKGIGQVQSWLLTKEKQLEEISP
jgi:adenylate cyclase